MQMASLIMKLFALFSVAGALTVLTILFIKLKRRELLLLIILIGSIAVNYGTAILLMANHFPDAMDSSVGYLQIMQAAGTAATRLSSFSRTPSVSSPHSYYRMQCCRRIRPFPSKVFLPF